MSTVVELRPLDSACWNCRRDYPADHDGDTCVGAPYPGATSNRYEPRGDRGWVA